MKQTFTFKNGKTLEFNTFPMKEKNLRNIRIHRDGEDGEGLWAFFSDEGVKGYDNSVTTPDCSIPVILANAALNFYPNNSWGLYIPVRLMGGQRPECNLKEVDFTTPIFCQERLDGDKKAKKPKKAKKKSTT